ncbi:MAG: hypothetical protein N3D82_05585 [Ignisphaera sp.]|nr:hypothetical protein [Ignisphaera sp.]MCX8168477.1 hypothetical protein [Ignisphaera sp.]MDW8085083.1 hypothetical protein [Ignisphaera sp.]
MSSPNVLDNLVKMLSSLLLDDKVSTTQMTKIFDEINKLSITMDSWCSSASSDSTIQGICSKFNEIMNKIIELTLKNVVVRTMNREVAFEQDILGKILTILIKILDSFRHTILKSIIVHDNKILCRVKKSFHSQYSVVLPGYVILVPIEDAVMLASLGYIDIIDVH